MQFSMHNCTHGSGRAPQSGPLGKATTTTDNHPATTTTVNQPATATTDNQTATTTTVNQPATTTTDNQPAPNQAATSTHYTRQSLVPKLAAGDCTAKARNTYGL